MTAGTIAAMIMLIASHIVIYRAGLNDGKRELLKHQEKAYNFLIFDRKYEDKPLRVHDCEVKYLGI